MKSIDLHEIDGFYIGNAEDPVGATGCTAIYCPDGAVAGVSVAGGGPATRETDLLKPENLVDRVHCIMLSGGSAFGLAASVGAMDFLEERDVGFATAVGKVPIVPAASLFDLTVGDAKSRPDRDMGYAALIDAEKNGAEEGLHGAGIGATVGKIYGMERSMKSGLGFWAEAVGPLQIGAVVAVNAVGDVLAKDGTILAGLLNEGGDGLASSYEAMVAMMTADFDLFQGNTTIGCIITNAALTKTEMTRVAKVAQDSLARAIFPVHTTGDGDTVFALAKGDVPAHVDLVATMAADVLATAIRRAVEVPSAYGIVGRLDL